MCKIIKSVVAALAALVMIQLATVARAEESAKPSFRVFKTLGEAVAFYKNSGQLPHGGDSYTGYSLEPFGSRAKAFAEAQEKAQKAGISAAIITQDLQRTYNTPPPGTKWFGTYDVASLRAITPVAANPENLLAELQRDPDAAGYYFELAQQAEYKGLTKSYRDIVRARNDENSQGISVLVRLIALHDGKACGDDLLKWAKYHKNPDVRLASYEALVQFGRASEVEEILKTEPNNVVKARVQKSLI